MSSPTKQSIVYVNFAPYENAGRILDFLVERFGLVVLFSFSFHRLNNKTRSNTITIWRNGQQITQLKLYQLPTPESMLFITLPLIIILIAIQTVWHLIRLRQEYGRFDLYLTVNAFTAWLGNLLRMVRVVDRTIFWVWDYYPPGYPDWRIRLARWGYWRFDKWSSVGSSSVVFLNQKLVKLRQAIGILDKDKSYKVVPIGTNPGRCQINKEQIIGHLGVLKVSQGLDLLFDQLPALQQKYPKLQVEIVGSGPDEAHFKERAKGFSNVKFYGFVKDEDKVDEIIRRWSAGIATYIPDKSSPASWTDPSKIKLYISQGVPVITTSITPFSREIEKARAGVLVDYKVSNSLSGAMATILSQQAAYKKASFELSQQYEYKKVYIDLFQ